MAPTTRRSVLAATAALAASGQAAGQGGAGGRFRAEGDQFVLDGKPIQILAGEMHYPRIPRPLWRDRMRKLKALGLNTLSTYVFWNAHEPTPGKYDFSGDLDVAAFIRLAQEEGLLVTLRPGPYVCAEWDCGGFPSWLFPTPDIGARSLDPRFMEPVRGWLIRLGQELAPLEIDRGGPIIMTQIENEYGAFGADRDYMLAQRQALRDAGFAGMLYTADPSEFFERGSVPGEVGGVNFGTKADAAKEFARRALVRPQGPFMCTELWGGWFDSFGRAHETMPASPLLASLEWMLARGHSISFYMLHGGTSWGFTAGANINRSGFQPLVSSYDYDALLDEAGRPTPKFEAVKALFRRYLPDARFGAMPEPEAAISVPRFRLTERAALAQVMAASVRANAPQTQEALGQSHGLVRYTHTAQRAMRGELAFGDVRDYALVRSKGEVIAVLDRRHGDRACMVDLAAGDVLEVLVDVMGRCNYGAMIGKDQKGLIGPATLDGRVIEGWSHESAPLDDPSALVFSGRPVRGPAFYRGRFDLKTTGYTFLDMRGWGKGYVWVNGRNLGRYWSVGPQRTVFVPGVWLKEGANDVVVLDLHESGERSLAGLTQPVWDRA